MSRPLDHLRNDNGSLPSIAWPGGYTILYLDSNGDTLCADCATAADADPDTWPAERPVAHFILWEGPPDQCAGCNKELPSEYGEPEAP